MLLTPQLSVPLCSHTAARDCSRWLCPRPQMHTSLPAQPLDLRYSLSTPYWTDLRTLRPYWGCHRCLRGSIHRKPGCQNTNPMTGMSSHLRLYAALSAEPLSLHGWTDSG